MVKGGNQEAIYFAFTCVFSPEGEFVLRSLSETLVGGSLECVASAAGWGALGKDILICWLWTRLLLCCPEEGLSCPQLVPVTLAQV